MTLQEMILIEEAECPANTFANCFRDKGYAAFYFDESPDLWEGNHAIIYPNEIKDLGKTLDQVKAFYTKRQHEAAIFHPLAPEHYHYFEENRSVIEQHGYEITLNDDYHFLTLSGKNTIQRHGLLDIRLLDGWDDRIGSDIILPAGEPWELASTKAFAQREGNFLFAGFVGDQPVIYVTLHKSRRFDCVRFDYILCAPEHRRHGGGNEILSYIVDYCRAQGLSNCFTWPASPYSERILRKAGFRDAFTARSGRINAKFVSG